MLGSIYQMTLTVATRGLSILLHGVISLPDATSCDKQNVNVLASHITQQTGLTLAWSTSRR